MIRTPSRGHPPLPHGRKQWSSPRCEERSPSPEGVRGRVYKVRRRGDQHGDPLNQRGHLRQSQKIVTVRVLTPAPPTENRPHPQGTGTGPLAESHLLLKVKDGPLLVTIPLKETHGRGHLLWHHHDVPCRMRGAGKGLRGPHPPLTECRGPPLHLPSDLSRPQPEVRGQDPPRPDGGWSRGPHHRLPNAAESSVSPTVTLSPKEPGIAAATKQGGVAGRIRCTTGV